MRRRGRALNASFFAMVALGVALTVELDLAGADPRLVSTVYGAVGLGLLVYRVLTTWDESTALVHGLGACLVLVLAAGAVASLQLAGHGPGAAHPPVEPVGASWPSVYTRLACILLALKWPLWLHKKTPPWRD